MSNPSTPSPPPPASERPVRFGLRSKITLPYAVLVVLLSLFGAFVITQLIVDSLDQRLKNQLGESARLVADSMVIVEQETLATLRAIAHTDGVALALAQRDADALQRLVLPIAANDGAEYVELIGLDGKAALSLHRQLDGSPSGYQASQGGAVFGQWAIVARAQTGESDVQGDKYADLIETPWGDAFYIAGPVKLEGETVGVVAVGLSIDSLVDKLQKASAGHVTIFDVNGQVMESTLYLPDDEMPISTTFRREVLVTQEVSSRIREVEARGREYAEIFGPLEARGQVDLAVFSTALERNPVVRASPITQLQLILLIGLILVCVIFVGTTVAHRITTPLLQVVQASRAVAIGDLSQRVEVRTGDEVGVLADSFNEMVNELRRGQFINEAFGRAVSPEVREAILEGQLELGGETRQITVLFSDIRGFTTLSEPLEPQVVVKWLNEYLGMMTEAINAHGGVVNKFVGDAVVAIFGAPQSQPDTAQRAVQAAFEMKARLAQLNQVRQQRGDTRLENGIGLSTGPVVAGIIGSEERLEYTVIGDTVNVASRLESLTKEYPDYEVLATAETVNKLSDVSHLRIDDLGDIQVKGRTEPVRVYGLRWQEAT